MGNRNGKICAVLTTLNPDTTFYSRIRNVAGQVDQTLIIDNHSGEAAVAMLYELDNTPGISVIFNDRNRGVAAAFNQGFAWAAEHDCNWVLLLDQDTAVSDNLVDALFSCHEYADSNRDVGVVGANFLNTFTGLPFVRVECGGARYAEVKTVISAGSLISTEAFKRIGPFRDEFFIDFVDIEYCLRARAKGYKVMLIKEPLMRHNIGAAGPHRILGRTTASSNHSPARRYFMMRNNVVVIREYIFIDPVWATASVIIRLKSLILMCLFENQRLLKAKYTLLGLIDGLFNKFGRPICLEADKDCK
jgi:rhamnosyltransferase